MAESSRVYESGASKRKKKQARKEELKKVPRLTQFFGGNQKAKEYPYVESSNLKDGKTLVANSNDTTSETEDEANRESENLTEEAIIVEDEGNGGPENEAEEDVTAKVDKERDSENLVEEAIIVENEEDRGPENEAEEDVTAKDDKERDSENLEEEAIIVENEEDRGPENEVEEPDIAEEEEEKESENLAEEAIIFENEEDRRPENEAEEAVIVEDEENREPENEAAEAITVEDEELAYFVSPHENDPINVKQALWKKHPIQPTDFKDRAKPFESANLYYRKLPNGQTIKRKWLSYSITLNKIFCANCMVFGDASSTAQSAFRSGYQVNIKNVYKDAERHEKSKHHQLATSAALLSSKNQDIENLISRNLSNQRAKEIDMRRKVISRLIDITLFLARQGLAFRGKVETAYSLDQAGNHGNFLELVLLLANYDPILKEHVKTSIELSKNRKKKAENKGRGSLVTFLSKTFLNKLIRVIGAHVQSEILKDLKNSKQFSVMMDSTQDVAIMDQLAICVRYIKDDAAIERLLDLVVAHDSTGQGLFDQLQREFEKFGLSIVDVVGSSFDGASNMKGIYNGLQAKMKAVNPSLIYTHCMAHVLNLVISDCITSNILVQNLFGLVQESAVFLSSSHKRMDLWRVETGKRHQHHAKLSTLHQIGATRWWSKHKALQAILGNIDDTGPSSKFVTFLSFLSSVLDGNFDCSSKFKARTFVKQWSEFENIFTAFILLDLFEITTPVSLYLQSKSLDYLKAWTVVDTLINQLTQKRTDEYFQALYVKCKTFVKTLNEEFEDNQSIHLEEDFAHQRISKKKKFFEEKAEDDISAKKNPAQRFRVNFYEIYDTILSSMEERFVPNKDLFLDVSWLSPKQFELIKKFNSNDEFPPGTLTTLSKMAQVDSESLKSELKQFAGLHDAFRAKWPSYERTSIEPIKKNEDNCEIRLGGEEEIDDAECEEVPEAEAAASNCDQNCIHCVFKIINELSSQSGLFNNLFIVYKYILSLPCTQVTCERVFSKLKIIKNRLRSLLGQDLLTPLIIISIERDISENIKQDIIIEKLAATSAELKRLLVL